MATLAIDLAAVNAEASAWAKAHAAELVDASDEVRARIRALIARAHMEGVSPKEVATLLRDIVGLDAARMEAVQNFRARLAANGVDVDERQMRTAKYAQAQRNQRALTIARTELIGSLVAGQQMIWNHAVQRGALRPDNFVKQWITTPDELLCAACEELDEVTTGIDGTFPGTDVDGPPLHPNCRCAMGLVNKETR